MGVEGVSSTSGTTEGEGTGKADEGGDEDIKNIRVSTLGELKEKAPEMYNQICKSLAMEITNELRRWEERRKKASKRA